MLKKSSSSEKVAAMEASFEKVAPLKVSNAEYCFSEKSVFSKMYLFWKGWCCAEVPAFKK